MNAELYVIIQRLGKDKIKVALGIPNLDLLYGLIIPGFIFTSSLSSQHRYKCTSLKPPLSL